jgi:uncharacterized lipoprotein
VLWHYVHLGQAGEDKQGKIPAGFEAEVQQALDNVGVVLQKAGMTAADADHSRGLEACRRRPHRNHGDRQEVGADDALRPVAADTPL